MELSDLVDRVEDFTGLPPREKIRLFAWHLHTNKSKEVLDNAAVRACFQELHLSDPNVSLYTSRMLSAKPPDLIKAKSGFKLERSVRTALDAEYGVHQTVVQVSKLLADLPDKLPNLVEKSFLVEAIKCYHIGAFRACVVMTWNLAYSHLLHWVLNDARRLSDFNAAISRRFPKKPPITVASYDSFEELKESEVIDVCNTAGLLNGNVVRVLKEKLGRRNTAAHPSSVTVVQPQADDTVTDLVNNVVLSLT